MSGGTSAVESAGNSFFYRQGVARSRKAGAGGPEPEGRGRKTGAGRAGPEAREAGAAKPDVRRFFGGRFGRRYFFVGGG